MTAVDRPIVIGGAMAALAVAVVLSYYAVGKFQPEIDAGDEAMVALGNTVYDDYCATCHGAELEGAPNWREPLPDGGLLPPPHDMSGHTWHHADAQLFAIVKYGGQSQAPEGFTSNMPAYETLLGDREIAAVVSYIQSRWPEEILDDRRRNLNPAK
jgi:mono/diheme cytochrome c family protein